MRIITSLVTVVLSFLLAGAAHASTYRSVEPFANSAVIDAGAIRGLPLRVREAIANRFLQCGIVDRVVRVLISTGAVTTINDLNTHVAVGGRRVLARCELRCLR